MTELEARDWVLFWVKDLHRRAGRIRFLEENQERIDGSVLFNSAHCLWEVRPTYRLSQWHEN